MQKDIPNVVWRNGQAHFRAVHNGKEYWRSLKTTLAGVARKRAAKLYLKLLADGELISPRKPRLSVQDVADRYTSQRGPELKPYTLKDHTHRLDAFVAWADRNLITAASAVTPEVLMRYRSERAGQVEAATVKSDLSSVRAAFTFAVTLRLLRENPFDYLPKAPKSATAEKVILTWDEMMKVLDSAPDSLKDILSVALFGGLRRGELLNLRWEDIDRGRHLIHVVNRPHEFTVKTYEARSLPLARYLEEHLPKGKTGRVADTKHCYLSIGASRAFRKAGVKGSLHLLRHNWITYMLLVGHPLARVMAWAGHSNISTTQGYLHVRQEVAVEDVAKFEAAVGVTA